MPDYLRRAVRSFLWSFLGVLGGSGVLSTAAEKGVVDWSSLKKVGISAFFAGVVAVVTFVVNLLEDTTAMPAMLKTPAPKPVRKATKKTGQRGSVTATELALVLIAAVAVLWACGVVPR